MPTSLFTLLPIHNLYSYATSDLYSYLMYRLYLVQVHPSAIFSLREKMPCSENHGHCVGPLAQGLDTRQEKGFCPVAL